MRKISLFALIVPLLISVIADAIPPLTEAQLSRSSIRVSAVQMTGTWQWQGNNDAPQDTVDAVLAHIEQAGREKADMVVFPELLLGKFRVPNESTSRIADAARKYGLYVFVGCLEVIDDAGRFQNQTLIFGRDGEIVGRFAKIHPAVGEMPGLWPPRPDDADWLAEDGDGFHVFDLDFGRVGVIICYDGYFPESFRVPALKGAELIVWMSAHSGVVEEYIVRAAMHHNYVHVVATNKAFGAGTLIAEWPNKIRARCEERETCMITADLHFAHLREARRLSREYFQRRPEVYAELSQEAPVWEMYALMPPTESISGEWAQVAPIVVDTPATATPDMAQGAPLSFLGFELSTPWMEGHITLRLPEVLQSNLGCHFNDTNLAHLKQLSPIEPWPEWQHNAKLGEWRYEYTTREGIYFSGAARPLHDTVFLEFVMRNDTGAGLAFLDGNPCFNLSATPTFRHPNDLSKLYTWIDGKFTPLSATTPTPEQKGRSPWVILRNKTAVRPWDGPDDSDTWWLIDQTADYNLLVVESADGKHLVGYAWDAAPPVLMSNCGYPCLHTGPAAVASVAAGETVLRRGAVYFTKNNPEALLQRYLRDRASWDRWPQRPLE